jgi:hypothetical protein
MEVLIPILVAQLCPLISAQIQGDVRLVGVRGSNNSGRVEVFFKSQWGTICDRNFAGAASTICHQFNSTLSLKGTSVRLLNESLTKAGKPGIEGVATGTPIELRDVDCGPTYSTPLVKTHILQCDYKSVGKDSGCSHDDDLAVVCDVRDRSLKGYDSEVKLVGGNTHSFGTVEVYLNKKWGNICYQGFQRATADTICRQLGYTHAQNVSQTNQSTDVVWLKDVTCKTSHPCLNDCFGKHKLIDPTTCSDGAYAAVQCSFEPAMVIDTGSFFGNPVKCSLQRRYSKTPAYFVAIMSVSSVFWIITSSVVITLAVCCSTKRCPCYKLRKRDTYTSINNR